MSAYLLTDGELSEILSAAMVAVRDLPQDAPFALTASRWIATLLQHLDAATPLGLSPRLPGIVHAMRQARLTTQAPQGWAVPDEDTTSHGGFHGLEGSNGP